MPRSPQGRYTVVGTAGRSCCTAWATSHRSHTSRRTALYNHSHIRGCASVRIKLDSGLSIVSQPLLTATCAVRSRRCRPTSLDVGRSCERGDPEPDQPEVRTRRAAAAFADVSATTVSGWINRGLLPQPPWTEEQVLAVSAGVGRRPRGAATPPWHDTALAYRLRLREMRSGSHSRRRRAPRRIGLRVRSGCAAGRRRHG
jgi:hypothetical protein